MAKLTVSASDDDNAADRVLFTETIANVPHNHTCCLSQFLHVVDVTLSTPDHKLARANAGRTVCLRRSSTIGMLQQVGRRAKGGRDILRC